MFREIWIHSKKHLNFNFSAKSNCAKKFPSSQKVLKLAIFWNSINKRGICKKKLTNVKSLPSKMKAVTILILTLMISAAICQDETDRKPERGVVGQAVGLSIGVIFGIIFGVIFVFCIFVSICCLPCCMVGC